LHYVLGEKETGSDSERTSPIGLRISAGLLVVLGWIFALYVLFFGLLLGVSIVRHWQGHAPASDKPSWFFTLLIGVATTAAVTYLCFRAAAALRNAQRWAAYVATGFGVLLLLFSVEFF
jgi:hypothetical protein